MLTDLFDKLFDKLPPALQLYVLLGGLLVGAIMYRRGARTTPAQDETDRLRDQVAASKIRADVAAVMESHRLMLTDEISAVKRLLFHEIGGLENRLREVEQDCAVMMDRTGGQPAPPATPRRRPRGG